MSTLKKWRTFVSYRSLLSMPAFCQQAFTRVSLGKNMIQHIFLIYGHQVGAMTQTSVKIKLTGEYFYCKMLWQSLYGHCLFMSFSSDEKYFVLRFFLNIVFFLLAGKFDWVQDKNFPYTLLLFCHHPSALGNPPSNLPTMSWKCPRTPSEMPPHWTRGGLKKK